MQNPQLYQHHFSSVDNIRFHYLSAGRENANVVVLLAGFPQSSYAWRDVIPGLANHFHIIAPDLPGQGDSDFPADGYDTDSIAQRVMALLQQLGITRFHLVGHDIGAWVAWSPGRWRRSFRITSASWRCWTVAFRALRCLSRCR